MICPLGELCEGEKPRYNLSVIHIGLQTLRMVLKDFSTLLLATKTIHLSLNLGKSKLEPSGKGLTVTLVER